jgi:hypothetical protein
MVRETGLNVFFDPLEKSIKAFIPGAINGTGPQDKERKLTGSGQGQFLAQKFAFPIGRDRFARMGFIFLLTALTRPSLTRLSVPSPFTSKNVFSLTAIVAPAR